jgi:hypothetical protein
MTKAKVGQQLAFASFETAAMFVKNNTIHIYKKLTLDEGLELITKMSTKTQTPYETISLAAKNPRHRLFTEGHLFCSCCALEGTEFRIYRDRRSGHESFVLSLFGPNNKGDMVELTWDHIVPQSVYGSNRLSNSQIMCSKCNMDKGNKLSPAEYTKLMESKEFHLMVTDVKAAKKCINSLIKGLKYYKGLKTEKFHHPVKEVVYNHTTNWVETLLARNKPKLLNLKHQVWRFNKVTLG